ncbi:MAG: ribosome maturation factor RimM [Bacteroidota bacterium]
MQHIGYTKKAKGLDGSLKVKIFEEYLEDFARATVLFLEINGKPLPYFIQKVEVQQDLVVQLEEVSDRNAAALVAGKPILLRTEDLLAATEREWVVEGLTYAHLEGFTLVDETIGVIGTIGAIIELPQQEMAIVEHDGKEVLIPLNEQLITHLDESQQLVRLDLPTGLLQL